MLQLCRGQGGGDALDLAWDREVGRGLGWLAETLAEAKSGASGLVASDGGHRRERLVSDRGATGPLQASAVSFRSSFV